MEPLGKMAKHENQWKIHPFHKLNALLREARMIVFVESKISIQLIQACAKNN